MSRQSLARREMAKKLRVAGFEVTCYKAMEVIATLKLQAKQRAVVAGIK